MKRAALFTILTLSGFVTLVADALHATCLTFTEGLTRAYLRSK